MIPYAAKLAVRHLTAHPGQTALLMVGVALGVSVFIFISALIGGLATLLTARTVGSIPHIVLESPDRDPKILRPKSGVQAAVQKDLSRREQIAIWQPAIPIIEATPRVVATSPQIRGSAYVERGQALAAVGVIGVPPGKVSDIADISAAIVDGDDNLPSDGILIGITLAEDLGLRVGQVVRLQSERGRARSFRIGGIFDLGIASADRQAVYMNFTTARALFDLPTGISRIEVKVSPAVSAPEIAERLHRSTGLKATAWTQDNNQLFEALDAQGRTGLIIKIFSLVTITVGIASAMSLSIVRRESEIGVMRAMGARKKLVVSVFVLEGALIGIVGAIGGAMIAALALAPLPPINEVASGGLPIDRQQGDYALAIALTTAAAVFASIAPALRAAQIDPVEAIGA